MDATHAAVVAPSAPEKAPSLPTLGPLNEERRGEERRLDGRRETDAHLASGRARAAPRATPERAPAGDDLASRRVARAAACMACRST